VESRMTTLARQVLTAAITIQLGLSAPAGAAVTDIANLPVGSSSSVKPNVVFILDDSGSMDFEVLISTNDGAFWWDTTTRNGWSASGAPNYNTVGVATANWFKYSHLFPNGCTQDTRRDCDTIPGNAHFGIPPTAQFASLRSSVYNPLYYNPTISYQPWTPAYIAGSTRTFVNVSATAARSHPYFGGGAPVTINLTQPLTSQVGNWVFVMQAGMVIPGATIPGITAKRNNAGGWTALNTDYTIAAGEYWVVSIPYFPATYWMPDPACASGPDCAPAPDGVRLRRYEIKSGNTFPGGRTYAEELQNFANWFTYYRKRKLMLAGASGSVLNQVRGLRGGVVQMNSLSSVTMYDANNASDSLNLRSLLGTIYQNPSNGGTPTREALQYVGQQYLNNSLLIQYACQRNNAFVLTDGFALVNNSIAVPAYSQSTWGGTPPYTTTTRSSLADIALAYYTVNLKPSFPAAQVPYDVLDTSPAADRNSNLHMTTYAMTLGTKGSIFNTPAQPADVYANPPTWPAPSVDRSPTAVDDLWHATINSRGLMFDATDPVNAAAKMQATINDIIFRSAPESAVAVTSVNLRAGDNTAFVSSYNLANWYGEIGAYPVDVVTGSVLQDSPIWTARDQLDSRDPNARLIATYNGASGIPFRWTTLPETMQSALMPSAVASDGQALLAWVRGDRALEGLSLRRRIHVLGDIVNAEPVYVKGAQISLVNPGFTAFQASIATRTPMVYQAANDGMLHAFDAATGAERWAYVPSGALASFPALANPTYAHRFIVDGTPAVGDANFAGVWHTILVGGLRGGGAGYYALDITSPAASSEGGVAAKVLWEFPNASTPAAVRNNLGLSFGKPVVVETVGAGWVVLVTSGYNNTSGDGKGHLFALNAANGSVIADLVTAAGSPATPAGLAQVSAFTDNARASAVAKYAYGGDLLGNLWKFDLSAASAGAWSVSQFAVARDDSGNPQPIAAAPELGNIDGKPLVSFGTGKLLGDSDIADTSVQSMYTIYDDGTALANARGGALVRRTAVVAVNQNRTITGDPLDWTLKRGWYFDFPGAGERANTDSSIAFGALVFTTNQPSPVECSSKNFIYALDEKQGVQEPDKNFDTVTGLPWAGMYMGTTIASRPVLISLPSGKVDALVHQADNTVATIRLPITGGAVVARRLSWREVLR
jgi:type IV pilus assembly protein PilY1